MLINASEKKRLRAEIKGFKPNFKKQINKLSKYNHFTNKKMLREGY